MVSDRTLGGTGLVILISSFSYYTLWTLVTPFLPPSSPLCHLFPFSREWAIRLPALVVLCGLSFVGLLTGLVLVETAASKRDRARSTRMRDKGD
ncbi:hypothetical protein JCM3775_004064 [Rhodotorula graminis]|uniref:Dolichol phosphate-mannose biosynthesis regulatory protein n=1 Tax=Rhodotorula graminis (strain WP1) TaxID=578459 RepID=A0A0P9ELI2_RHOGW|nr:uncharacterized protein RHOBADRAFT_46636 [Rhodotorula graminis WP1]KPV72592.1 hypothetical protein RHOBADRAFT_46636 [Rhodotorula graminis WP1]